MKIKNIKKYIKDEIEPHYWLTVLLPLMLIIWILWQVVMLSKYNAIAFFSWSQIFSDTAILFIPLLSFLFGFISIKALKGFDKTDWKIILRSVMFIVYITIIIAALSWVLIYFKINVLSYYIVSLFSSFLLWAMTWAVESKNKAKEFDDKWLFLLPSASLGLVVLPFILIYSLFTLLYSYIYMNVDVKIKDKQYKVEYMNDKYIIYWSWNVISNDWKYEFKVYTEIPIGK